MAGSALLSAPCPLTAPHLVALQVSDSIAQALGSPVPFSLARACKLGAFGMTVGAVSGHYWHRWLDRAILPSRPQSGLAVAQKVALDQGLFSPLMLTAFLLYVQLLEGRPDFSLVYLQVRAGQPGADEGGGTLRLLPC